MLQTQSEDKGFSVDDPLDTRSQCVRRVQPLLLHQLEQLRSAVVLVVAEQNTSRLHCLRGQLCQLHNKLKHCNL